MVSFCSYLKFFSSRSTSMLFLRFADVGLWVPVRLLSGLLLEGSPPCGCTMFMDPFSISETWIPESAGMNIWINDFGAHWLFFQGINWEVELLCGMPGTCSTHRSPEQFSMHTAQDLSVHPFVSVQVSVIGYVHSMVQPWPPSLPSPFSSISCAAGRTGAHPLPSLAHSVLPPVSRLLKFRIFQTWQI